MKVKCVYAYSVVWIYTALTSCINQMEHCVSEELKTDGIFSALCITAYSVQIFTGTP